MRTPAILVVVAACARAACVAVPSDKILARDLLDVVPLFQALDPQAVIGFSPFPGTDRVLSSRDLLLTASRYGLAFSAGELVPSVCVQRIVRSLSIEEVRDALLSAMDQSGAQRAIALEIVEFSNNRVPPGRLVFQLTALNKPPGNDPQTPVLWLGKLRYDDQHSLSVWARVRISVKREVFLARQSIPKGQVIRAEQIAPALLPEFPWPEPPPSSAAGIVGKVARRAIPAGQKILPLALDDPKDVMQGETVHVKVVEGMTTITLDAVAQSSGTKGESILVHNPSSGKSFRALVEDRGQVLVIPSAGGVPQSSPRSSL
jgi:flagella basal body P-ring formation protein FlgA